MPSSAPERTLVLWCPDWPVRAAAAEAGAPRDAEIAVIEKGFVAACSAAARAAGVRRGLRIREAQSRCATLVVLPANPAADARRFEPVLVALEAGIPTVQVVRPGVVVIRAQGPTRYFGGEQAAAEAALGLLADAGVPEARAGIADGPFAAEQAARTADPATRVRLVPPGGSAAFLAPLPVSLIGLPQVTAVLAKLGIRSLGAFAALDADQVRDRFGPEGEAAHRVAQGLDPRRLVPRVKPKEYARQVNFEPPLDRVDQIAFALRQPAEALLDGLAADRLVLTGLLVELTADDGGGHARTWLHPRSFTPLDVIDRVRWQLQGAGLAAPVTSVRLVPDSVDLAASHEEGLWGGGPDERIHHALSRVQSLLGHEAVLTAQVGGGRLVADRRVLAPWGERRAPARPADRPWPGRLPGFSPATVFEDRPEVRLVDPAGVSVSVDERGLPSGPPAGFTAPDGGHAAITAWAGPWPVEERWWDPQGARSLSRMQIAADDGSAWLVCFEDGGWWAEARYD
ncbi:DNA polymerase Y family protein [Amnibacterium sp. CER49]|uniref:DNA polymerase Y family protein n=1 Tax=Amnibacterium sp. CER49 TaxID=3039161 RepID=UPI0024492786|nr:DNA polymerase Y family protein [Amnibacterium sp. CER49]MDH2444457.1 DNA polymerase Y family protein [Amnibacterium sp. CER49]